MFLTCLDLQELGLLMEAPEKSNKDEQRSADQQCSRFRKKKRHKELKKHIVVFVCRHNFVFSHVTPEDQLPASVACMNIHMIEKLGQGGLFFNLKKLRNRPESEKTKRRQFADISEFGKLV